MKERKFRNLAIIFGVIALIAITVISLYMIILKTNKNQQDEFVDLYGQQLSNVEDLSTSVRIDTESHTYTNDIYGEIQVDVPLGSRVGNYRNGYCMSKGASLEGGVSEFDSSVSAYTQYADNGEIKWLLDNMPVVFKTNPDETFVNQINFYKKMVNAKSKGSLDISSLNFYELFEVQQTAIWHFTNDYEPKADAFNSYGDKSTIMKNYYNYLVTNASANSKYSLNGSAPEMSITKTTDLHIEKTNDGKIVWGPYSINTKGEFYEFLYTNLFVNNTEISHDKVKIYKDRSLNDEYEIKRGTVTNYNGNIYIVTSSYNASNISKYDCTINFELTRYKTIAKYWSNNSSSVQPVTTVEKTKTPYKISLNEVEYDGEYALYVKKVDANNQSVGIKNDTFEVKETVIRNEKKIKDGELKSGSIKNSNTLEIKYNSLRDAGFKIGDKVTYTIVEKNVPDSKYIKYDKKVEINCEVAVHNNKSLIFKVLSLKINGVETNVNIREHDNGNVLFGFNYDNKNMDVTIKNKEASNGKLNLRIYKINKNENNNLIKIAKDTFQVEEIRYRDGKETNRKFITDLNIDETGILVNYDNLKNEGFQNGDKIVYNIQEINAPEGYVPYNKVFKIESSVTIINGDLAWVVDKASVDGNEISSDKVSRYTDDYEIDWVNDGSGQSVIKIKNSKIDLALKKSINVVNSNGVAKEVSLKNGFNVSRTYTESSDYIDGKITEFDIDLGNMSYNTKDLVEGTSTNALYSMNKTPVEVHIGDKIQYTIRVFNEGEVDTLATGIADYIPKGLLVTGVSYVNSDGDEIYLLEKNDNQNSVQYGYSYDRENGYLYIGLNQNDESDFIPAFNKQTKKLSYSEIKVTCEVLSDATGVLTNVAEITEYGVKEIVDGKSKLVIVDEDIDSTAHNWKNPNGDIVDEFDTTEHNKLTDKSTEKWREYKGLNDAKLTGEFENNYLAQDNGRIDVYNTTFKGDDDDFDKVIVIDQYKVSVLKVSNENNEQKLAGVEFYIGNKEYSSTSKIEKEVGTKVTNSEGMTESVSKDIFYSKTTNEEDVYYIKETKLPDDLKYSLINTEFELRIKKKVNANGTYSLDLYSFGIKGTEASYKALTETINTVVEDDNRNQVTVNATYNSSEKRFEITVPNNVGNSNYIMKLYKVTANSSNSTINNIQANEQGISGIKFGINTLKNPLTTNANGLIDFGSYEITKNNYQDIDEFKITEIEDENSRYYQLKDGITVYVKKDLNDTKNNYIVKEISLDGTQYSSTSVTKEVELKGSSKKVIITVTLEGNIITVKVPNIEKDGQYSLVVKKVSKNNIKLGGAEFILPDGISKEVTDENGLVTIVSGKAIDSTNVNLVDSYVIKELKAPIGYVKLATPININVNKGDDGDGYIVTSVDVFIDGGTPVNIVNKTYGTLNGVRVENSSETVNLTIDLQNTNTILVTVPNVEVTGKYKIEIYKYNKVGNNVEPVNNIKFKYSKNNANSVLFNSTNVNGLTSKEFKLVKDDAGKTDVYEISEVIDKEDNYIGLVDSFKINVQKSYNNDKTKCIISGVTFDDGTNSKILKLENDKTVEVTVGMSETEDGITTIRLEVENDELQGNYVVDLEKVVDNRTLDGTINNVKFDVQKNDEQVQSYFTSNDGIVEFASEEITKEIIGSKSSIINTYKITEIGTDKLIKLKEPITLKITVSRNDLGTKYIVSNYELSGKGISGTKVIKGNKDDAEIKLEGIVLEDNSTIVDIIAKMTEVEDSNGNTHQKISLIIPNKEKKGSYDLEIKKVNASKNNINIFGAVFKIESVINGETQQVKETERTSSSLGTVKVLDEIVTMNSETINTPDTYKITEVKIYKSEADNTEADYAKLKNPIILTVEKENTESEFAVKQLKLSSGDNESITGKSILLENVELESGDLVTVEAKINDDNIITVTIPNKEYSGSYSIDIIKTTNNFETGLSNFAFNATGNSASMKTNSEGKIENIITKTINKDTLGNDVYHITEVNSDKTSKNNNYLELSQPLDITVEKARVGNVYEVTAITLACGDLLAPKLVVGTDSSIILENIPTVKNGTATKVKIEYDNSTKKITVFVDNPKVEGEYKLKIKKVDSQDLSKVIPGVTFSASIREQQETGGAYTVVKTISQITQDSEDANIKGYAVFNSEKINKNNFLIDINETSTVDGYELLKDINIQLKVEAGLSEDGTKKVIKSVNAVASRSIYDDETADRLKMITQGLNVTVDDDGTTINVTIPNQGLTEYAFNLDKVEMVDGNEEFLQGALFTVKGPDGELLLDNQSLDNSFVKSYDSVKTNKTYTFTITENQAPTGYRNILYGFDLLANIYIDIDGNVVENKLSLNVKPQNENYDRNAYSEIQSMVNDGKIKLILDKTAKNSVRLKIENERNSTYYNFKLLKTEVDSSEPLQGAEFTVIKNGIQLSYPSKTNLSNFMIDEVENIKSGETNEYIIEETRAPENYNKVIKKVKVVVNSDMNAKLTTNITEVVMNNGNDDQWVSYDSEVHGKTVKLEKDPNGDRTYLLHWENPSSYVVYLYKESFDKEFIGKNYSSDLIAIKNDSGYSNGLPLLENVEFKVETPDGEQTITTASRAEVLTKNNVKANQEYIYTFKEITTPSEYIKDFDGINIVLHLRTDSKAGLMEVNQNRKNINSYYEIIDTTNTRSKDEIQRLYSKVFFGIKDRNAYLFMVNTKQYEKNYQLQLWKTDKKTGESLKGAEFEIKITDNNGERILDSDSKTAGIQNFKTDENGLINIDDLKVEDGTHVFTITEVKSPNGYLLPENMVITATVDVSNAFNNVTKIRPEDVSLNVTGTTENITSRVDQNGLITIIIPNESTDYLFKLRKLDLNNNLIISSINDNGVKQGTKMNFVANGDFEISDSYFFDEGEYTYKCNTNDHKSQTHKTYTYRITESEAKQGYINILEGSAIEVSVVVDENGRLLPVDPNNQMKDSDNVSIDTNSFYTINSSLDAKLTREQLKQYINLYIVDNDDGTQTVMLDIYNPWDYTVRLRKTDTNNKELNKAYLIGDFIKNGETEDNKLMLMYKSKDETEDIIIGNNETHTWVIDEITASKPYQNILEDDKKLYITATMNDGVLSYDYEVRDIVDGNEVVYNKDNKIYDFIKVNLLNENGNRVLDVQIINPVIVTGKLAKLNMHSGPITSALLKLNDISNEKEDGTYSDNISDSKQYVSIGDVVMFTAEEIEAKSPYINIFGNNKIFVEALVNENGKLQIVGKGYFDENNVRHDGFDGLVQSGNSDDYVLISTSEVTTPTVLISMKNPIEIKVNVHKKDENGEPLSGAHLELIEVNQAVVENVGNDGTYISDIEYITNDNKDNNEFIIKEIEPTKGYVNVFENKEIHVKTYRTPTGISVSDIEIYNITSSGKTLIDKSDEIYNEVNITKSNLEIENGNTPQIDVELINSTDITIDIEKQLTNGVAYDGAEIELGELVGTSYKKLSDNLNNNNETTSNIQEKGIKVLPNKTYTYVIKELSTKAPHVNILKDGNTNKEIRISFKLNKDVITGELTPEYSYNIYDQNGNVLENDGSKEYISVNVVKDEITGKYTIKTEIKNPVEFKMTFLKTDTSDNPISGIADFVVGGIQNDGTASETYTMKIGETKTISVSENNVKVPFKNALNGATLIFVVRLNDKEQLETIDEKTILDGQVQQGISREYFDYVIEDTDKDGIYELNIKLKNPMEFKFKLTKQDMAGLGLNGADISVTYDGRTYKTNGDDSIEIPVLVDNLNKTYTFTIKENSSKENYENVFESQIYNLVVGINKIGDKYVLAKRTFNKITFGTNGNYELSNVDSNDKYISTYIDNDLEDGTDILTAHVIMKNPIKYDFEVIKTDLSGNELKGDNLQIQVTKNSDETKSNQGKSTIRFEERDLVPNTVNTYVIEELSTIAPYVNEFVNKKLTVEVKVDEKGGLSIQKLEVTDKTTGEIVENTYVDYDDKALSNDGTRLIKIFVKNPISYKVKVEKTTTKSTSNNLSDKLEGASFQVNDVLNTNGASEINMEVNDVKIGDTKVFEITENESVGVYDNVLNDKVIVLTTQMGNNAKLKIISAELKDKNTEEKINITEEIKKQYKFDYEIVTGEDGYETVHVIIENPVKVQMKVVKKDASGITELSGAHIQLKKDGEVVADNKETGNSILEYVQHNVSRGDMLTFLVNEVSSAKPNENILNGRTLTIVTRLSDNDKLQMINHNVYDNETGDEIDLSEFINVEVKEIDGIKTVVAEIINPTGFDIDLVKHDTGLGFLNNTKFRVYREDTNEYEFDGYVTDINTYKMPEVREHDLLAGTYTYYITETKTARERYINILDGKYIKVNVQVDGKGKVNILNNESNITDNYFEIYEYTGTLDNRTNEKLVDRNDSIYELISVSTLINSETNRYVVQCDITNPVKYQVEIHKTDSVNKPLEGAEFELVSEIIDSQNAVRTNMNDTIGIDNVSEDGVISGTTNQNGSIRYQENYVSAGTYEYKLKEIQTPGEQYVNPFKGYSIYFKVVVSANGDIELGTYDNQRNCYIVKDETQGQDAIEAPEDVYDFLVISRKNNTIIAKLEIDVENPVRYEFELDKYIYGDEKLPLNGANFVIESGLIKKQAGEKTTLDQTVGVSNVTRDGVVTGSTVIGTTTDENNSETEAGIISFEETMARPDVYEYWISEKDSGDPNVLNALQGMNIKVLVRVASNGQIATVTDDEQNQIIQDGVFYLYDSDRKNKIDFKTTSVDELIKVYITSENDVYKVHVQIDDPQRYDFELIKSDIDLYNLQDNDDYNMNDVKFEIKAYKENADGKQSEVKLKRAYDNTKEIDTSELVTANINEKGMIQLKDVLFESAGTYYFEFIETTPEEPIKYKDKAENVIIKVVIGADRTINRYVLESMEVVQGSKYVIAENTKIVDTTIRTNISNERVKGSYDLVIAKVEKLLGHPITGAEFAIEAFEDDKLENQITLYKATDDVTSMKKIVPARLVVKKEDGTFTINNIRIENVKPYYIKITEISAPDTYTLLDDSIVIKVTPKIEGENDDAKYVIDTVELISGENDGLVKLINNNEGNKFTVQVTNDQFDLALRKYISSINGKDVTRWTQPEVDTTKLITGESTTAEYYNDKLPLRVYAGQEIIYTLRVYNEGQIDGYVNKIVDYLPDYLEFLPNDEFNTSRGWKLVKDSKYDGIDVNAGINELEDVIKVKVDNSVNGTNSTKAENVGVAIETDYLSKARNEAGNVIKAFDSNSGRTDKIDYKEVQVKCRVKENAKPRTYITNIAEITEYEGKDRNDVIDRDSSGANTDIPSGKDREEYKQPEIEKQQSSDKAEDKYIEGQEDDDDFEKVIVERFDLALRKFITQVNENEVTTRIPEVKINANGQISYEHDKTPVLVAHDSLVTYTLRIFNEGTVSGYANLVKDDIPAGLVFVPENETNKEYRWKMLDKDEKETKDPSKAVYVLTDYLAEENGDNNLIKYFDRDTMDTPDYRDVKLVFKVNVPVRYDDIITNYAQITDDKDDHGDDVEDDDSIPNVWNEGEDDQDIENIRVKYFDLALYKWVTQAIVTENGKTTTYESNHSQSDKSDVVNVAIKKDQINNVVVKFKYTIKVENQGNLSGYAKEIKDHIPAGLKFVAEDNTEYGWVEEPDGTITNKCFENTLLNEGDTAETTVVLTWINGSNNLGQKINYAEISKDENDYGSPDVDSTPNNFKDTPVEDDEDGDVVMLQIRTGVPSYAYVILTAVAFMSIIAGGVFGIKKYVVDRD